MAEQDAAYELTRRFGPGPHWVIADQHDIFVGIVRLTPIDAANRSARLGIGIFDPARLGQGLGTEAIRLALGWGFDHLDLHRVSLTVLANNSRAIAAYTRCGFAVEGRLRDTLPRDGVWHDDLTMASSSRNGHPNSPTRRRRLETLTRRAAAYARCSLVFAEARTDPRSAYTTSSPS